MVGVPGGVAACGSVPAWKWAMMALNRRVMRRSRRQISLINSSGIGSNAQ
jgi:hypothetical protein